MLMYVRTGASRFAARSSGLGNTEEVCNCKFVDTLDYLVALSCNKTYFIEHICF